MQNELNEQNNFIMYTTDDGQIDIEVRLEDENVWLTQNSMAELFDTTKQNISLHIKNIFEEKELEENSVVKVCLTTAKDGKNYKTKFYNLDLIISVGYRVKSVRGTQFRIWANKLIKEYLIKGYNLNVERFKNNGGGPYFEEVLEKIREYNLDNDIIVTGYLKDSVGDYLKASDFAVLPFYYGISVRNGSFLAAYQEGIDIITTKGDKNFPYDDVYLMNDNTPQTIASAIEYMQDNSLKSEHRKIDFYWDDISKQHVELYEKIYG